MGALAQANRHIVLVIKTTRLNRYLQSEIDLKENTVYIALVDDKGNRIHNTTQKLKFNCAVGGAITNSETLTFPTFTERHVVSKIHIFLFKDGNELLLVSADASCMINGQHVAIGDTITYEPGSIKVEIDR